MFGLNITRGDGLPSRTCRSCYVKISKIEAFVKMILSPRPNKNRLSGRKEGSRLGIVRPQLLHRDQKEKKGRVRYTNVKFRKYRARDSLP